MKKVLEFQIVSKTREMNAVYEEYDRKLREKDNAFQELEKYTNSLEDKLTA
jgi:hypothetical protein